MDESIRKCVCIVYVYVYMMENYSAIKKETLPFAKPWMEFEGIMPKWSKLHRERRILYDLICGSKSKKKKKKKSELTGTEFRFKGLGVGKIGKGGKKNTNF